MKAVVLTLFLVACASANIQVQQALENGLHPFSADMVNVINNAQSTWTAKQHFTEKDMENVKVKLGAILNHKLQLDSVDESTHFDMTEEIPKEFDARKKWPKCSAIISDIRDQANCGSCWAFAAAGAISDRTCIASDGKLQVKLSADDMLSCCTLWSTLSFCGFGCNGGIIQLAWRFWVKKGLVTGGNFGENNTCRPYEINSSLVSQQVQHQPFNSYLFRSEEKTTKPKTHRPKCFCDSCRDYYLKVPYTQISQKNRKKS